MAEVLMLKLTMWRGGYTIRVNQNHIIMIEAFTDSKEQLAGSTLHCSDNIRIWVCETMDEIGKQWTGP